MDDDAPDIHRLLFQTNGHADFLPLLEKGIGFKQNAAFTDVEGSAHTVAKLAVACIQHLIMQKVQTVKTLEECGIGFHTLQESIDTSTSGGKLVFHLFGALAEFERNLIRERTEAGLSAARARGRYGGRPRALNKTKTELLYKLYDERQHSIAELCELLEISKTTLYEYLKRRS